MPHKEQNSNFTMFLFLVFVFLFIVLLYSSCNMYNKKVEKYADVYFNKDLNTIKRESFNSNLDPNNPNNRFDSNVYGGYIKGNSPDILNQAAANMMSKENFASVGQDMNQSIEEQSSIQNVPVKEGFEVVSSEPQKVNGANFEINDAASYVDNSAPPQLDFANVAAMKSARADNKMKVGKFNASQNSPNKLLDYTLPSELLPTPDMSQPLMRDPSDPSNFMYTRTLFAPLKKRNRNEADRFRGDLDIEPVKTGWFDIATVPTVDLVKGYFGYYTDIQEYTDLQDIAYDRNARQLTGKDVSASNSKLKSAVTDITKDLINLKLAYASPGELPMPVEFKNNNPWGTSQAYKL